MVKKPFQAPNFGHEGTLLRDISQSFGRVRYSKRVAASGHVAMTFLLDQLVWVDARQPRCLLGREAMILQGFPAAKLPDIVSSTPEMLLQDLVGNPMASTVLLAILTSLFASVVRRSPPLTGVEDVDVAQAMQIFEISSSSLRLIVRDGSDHELEQESSSSLVSKRRKR